jgi:predicted hydrocarbon binding protein
LKGIVFNLLEEVVTRQFGADTWDDLLDAASVDGSYTSLGSYADEDLSKLVMAASSALQQPPEEVIRWFGSSAVPLLAEKYPAFFAPHSSARSFILTLNEIIHPEVRKIYPGADVPEFDFETSDHAVLLGYASKRRLCSFAQGLIEGTAEHYDEQVELDHLKCMIRGDDKCLIRVDFKTNGAHSN